MFSSTDHNLNDPNRVIQLNLGMEDPFSECTKVVNLRKEEYTLTKIKDPNTIYVITDSDKNEIYKGDLLISSDEPKRQYFISNGDNIGEYVLYLNEPTSNYDRLIPICRYKDPDAAIQQLHKLNHIGSHTKIDYQLYLLLVRYIKKEISLHEWIMATMTIFGHGKKSQFQELIQIIDSFHIISLTENPDSTKVAMLGLRRLPNKLCHYYADLYDLMNGQFNYFRGRKYRKDPDTLNLSSEILCIINVMRHAEEKETD